MFELSRLLTYDDDALLAELCRVAAIVSGPLTRSAFHRFSKASPSLYPRRFGSWEGALKRAGLESRYSGRAVSDKMRSQEAKHLTDEQMLAELQRVAALSSPLIGEVFGQHSRISAAAIRRRFGSWNAGLKKAGLKATTKGRRYTEDDISRISWRCGPRWAVNLPIPRWIVHLRRLLPAATRSVGALGAKPSPLSLRAPTQRLNQPTFRPRRLHPPRKLHHCQPVRAIRVVRFPSRFASLFFSATTSLVSFAVAALPRVHNIHYKLTISNRGRSRDAPTPPISEHFASYAI
jgi:hypothetical protein